MNRKLAEKGYKKKIKDSLERFLRRTLHRIFSEPNIKIRECQKNSRFGSDEYGHDIEDGLNRYVEVLKNRKLQVHTAVVLGSRAKRSWKPQSDIDITVIADGLPKEGTSLLTRRLSGLRRRMVLSDRPLYIGIEPSGCCSREEFLDRLGQFDVTALDAVFYGIVLFDDGFWEKVQEKYAEMDKEYGLAKIPLKDMLFPL